MKGIVFTEFLEMVEEKFGFEMADQVVSESNLASGGVYTAVGTYPHGEMASLVTKLSEKSGIELPVLLNTFGHHLFSVFLKSYGMFFENVQTTFDFLAQIDNYIHVEVLKLYPDAELPKFEVVEKTETKMVLQYQSDRSMGDLAMGLMEACSIHFNEKISVEKTMDEPTGKVVTFTLKKA